MSRIRLLHGGKRKCPVLLAVSVKTTGDPRIGSPV